VPEEKAHPHCMCKLIPRITREKKKGNGTYAEFLKTAPKHVRAAMLPNWARGLERIGFPLERLLRADGMGLLRREQAMEIIRVEWPSYAANLRA